MSRRPEFTPTNDDATVQLCPGGPMLVRGAAAVQDQDGRTWPAERAVVAVCRCTRSRRKPWCDSSHKMSRDLRALLEDDDDG